MFDISFGGFFVLMATAGFIFKKSEILMGARFLGRGLGKVVGSMQGMRIKFETETSKSEVHGLHSSVRQGLQDVRSIGNDVLSVTSGYGSFRPNDLISRPLPSHQVAVMPGTQLSNSASIGQYAHDPAHHIDVGVLSRLLIAEQRLSKSSELSHDSSGPGILQDVVTATVMSAALTQSLHGMSQPTSEASSGSKHA